MLPSTMVAVLFMQQKIEKLGNWLVINLDATVHTLLFKLDM